MAIPAILLFVVTCLAQIIASARGGTVLRGSDNGNVDIDASGGVVSEGDSSVGNDIVNDEGGLSVERHRHGHKGNRYNNNPASHNNKNSEVKDDSFDFYVYSMSYQPEFCRENDERFDGCHTPKASWEGQLTIHGLWPNVSVTVAFSRLFINWLIFISCCDFFLHASSHLLFHITS